MKFSWHFARLMLSFRRPVAWPRLFTLYGNFNSSGRCQIQPYNKHESSPKSVLVCTTLIYGGLFAFFKGDTADEVPKSVKRRMLVAQRAHASGDYDRCERFYHQALSLLASSKHSGARAYQEARAVVLDKLANVYLERGRWEEAEANLKETMRSLISLGVDKENEAIIELSLKLSKVYSNQRKSELAAVGFNWCVEAGKKKYAEKQDTESHALYGMCVHAKGQFHLLFGQYQEAAFSFSEALHIAESVYGSGHIQVAVLCNDLTTALDGLGDIEGAEKTIKRSLDVAAAVKDQDVSEYISTFYFNLGTILTHKGDKTGAAEAYQLAKKASKRT